MFVQTVDTFAINVNTCSCAWLEDVRLYTVLEYIESMLNIKLSHWQSNASYTNLYFFDIHASATF